MAILGFTLPPDSGEKLGLGGNKTVLTYEFTAALKVIFHELRIQYFPSSEVTIMLAITIFATIVGDILPVTDSTPLIGEGALD